MTPRYALEDRIVLITGAACGVEADRTKSDDFAAMSPGRLARELEISQRRVVEPFEVAATARFLASHRSRFYCGQVPGPHGGSVMP